MSKSMKKTTVATPAAPGADDLASRLVRNPETEGEPSAILQEGGLAAIETLPERMQERRERSTNPIPSAPKVKG